MTVTAQDLEGLEVSVPEPTIEVGTSEPLPPSYSFRALPTIDVSSPIPSPLKLKENSIKNRHLARFCNVMAVEPESRNHLSAMQNIGHYLSTRVDELAILKAKIISGETEIASTWSYLSSLTSADYTLMSDDNRSAVAAFKEWVATDVELLAKISLECLMALGQDENFYRFVFVTLVSEFSPGCAGIMRGFNAKLLLEGTAEQTSKFGLNGFIRRCEELPVEAIKQLGDSNPRIARNLLIDLQGHPSFDAISEYFYNKHWPTEVAQKNPKPKPTTPRFLPRKKSKKPSGQSYGKKESGIGRRALDFCLGAFFLASGYALYTIPAALQLVIFSAPYVFVASAAMLGVYKLKQLCTKTKRKTKARAIPVPEDSDNEVGPAPAQTVEIPLDEEVIDARDDMSEEQFHDKGLGFIDTIEEETPRRGSNASLQGI
jgi:hypothetical protein